MHKHFVRIYFLVLDLLMLIMLLAAPAIVKDKTEEQEASPLVRKPEFKSW
jgi:hypothetical protein